MDSNNATFTVVTVVPSTMRSSDDQARLLIEKGVPLDKLQQGFTRFLEGLGQIVNVRQGRVGDFLLEEITFSAEIGADGEFKLLGTGVGVSATSGVSFTLRRQLPPAV